MAEETYQDDLRYERAVWPEKFSMPETDKYVILGERILLTLQGIDISLERIADSKQTLSERLSSDDESA